MICEFTTELVDNVHGPRNKAFIPQKDIKPIHAKCPYNDSATNKNGLKASVTRDVAVTGISSAFDISGVYLRSGTSATTNVTKLGRGLFQTDNVGGNSLFDPAVFLIQTDSTILIPDQIFPSSGPASFSQAQITYGPPISISYAIAASGYGSQVRTFVKQ